MADREVRIVDLPPMRAASALRYGTDPEDQAFSILIPFAKRIGLEEVINPTETDPEKLVFDLYLPVARYSARRML